MTRNSRIEEVTNRLAARGFNAQEIFDLEIRLSELDVEIELYKEQGKAAELQAAKAELAGLFEKIGSDAQKYYDALVEESKAFNEQHKEAQA